MKITKFALCESSSQFFGARKFMREHSDELGEGCSCLCADAHLIDVDIFDDEAAALEALTQRKTSAYASFDTIYVTEFSVWKRVYEIDDDDLDGVDLADSGFLLDEEDVAVTEFPAEIRVSGTTYKRSRWGWDEVEDEEI